MKKIKIYKGQDYGYSIDQQSDIENKILQRFSDFVKDKNYELINIQTMHEVSKYGTHSIKMYFYYYEYEE